MDQGFPMRAGHSDIMSDVAPPTMLYGLPRFEENNLSRNSHPSLNPVSANPRCFICRRSSRHRG